MAVFKGRWSVILLGNFHCPVSQMYLRNYDKFGHWFKWFSLEGLGVGGDFVTAHP